MLARPLSAALGFVSITLLVSFAACGSDDEPTFSDEDESGSGGSGATSGSSSGGSDGGSDATSSGGGPASSSTGAGASGGAGCAGLGDPCSDCAFASCNALYCSCYDNPACGSLVACTQQCAPGDVDCAQNCLTMNQAGISDGALLSDCAAGACAAQCPTAAALGECELCAFQNCETQMNTCLANPECTALIECAQQCDPNDDFCLLGCAAEHGGGQDDAEAVQNCVAGPCPACG